MNLASFAAGLQVANSPCVLLELNLVSAARGGKVQAVGRGSWAAGFAVGP